MQKWEQIQGVYIHTPFCLQKCLYCDFASYAGADTETMEKYVDAVCSEIMMRSNEVTIADQATLYFGGGTPSLLSEKLLAKLVEALQKNGCWLQPAEATIEVNPGTADLDKLRFFKDLGFDRISFGVQSLNDAELRAVGRIHTANEALDAITVAEKAGFTRVSADLIYGLPEQSLQTLKTSLQNLTAAGLQHLSVYGLTIEKNTPLAGMLDKGKVELPDEDCQLAMYELVQEYLEAQGLHRYEISNYAKPGYECRHNLGYWERREYLGLGLGASSLIAEHRFCNTDKMDVYIRLNKTVDPDGKKEESKKAVWEKAEEVSVLSVQEQMEEFMFLGLRKTDGVSEKSFFETFGVQIDTVYGETIGKLEKERLLIKEKGQIRLTERGVDISNYVMSEFLF